METALPDGPRGQFLAAAFTLTVLAALWFGVAAPLIDWYHDGAEDLVQRRALLVRMQRAAETLPMLENQSADAHPAPIALLAGATDALAAAAMQNAVQGMATTAGIELTSMETLPAEKAAPIAASAYGCRSRPPGRCWSDCCAPPATLSRKC